MLSSNMRLAKIILLLIPAAQSWLLGIPNAFNFPGVVGEVTWVLKMTAVGPKMPTLAWRAIDSDLAIYAGAIFIIGIELLMGFLLFLGAYRMWQARALDKAAFNAAKRYGLWGCVCCIILFYGSFQVLAGNWFGISWLPTSLMLSVFRYSASISLIMLFVAETSQD